jgi:hypothetical protein
MNLDKFFSIVDSIVPNDRGCMIWPHAKDSYGYAAPSIKNELTGKKQSKIGSRLVLSRKLKREIKENFQALHTCDNPSCVNAEHLFEGTNKDNMQDKVKKKRHRCGNSKRVIELTSGNVFVSANEAAKFYNIHRKTINRCCAGKRIINVEYKFAYADSLISCEHANNIHIAKQDHG